MFLACSATIDRKSEQFILEKCEFRAEGNNPGDLEIIRTSIDHPDISICICPMPAGKVYERLGYLLKDAVDVDSKPTPLKISKVIILFDGINKIRHAVDALQTVLYGSIGTHLDSRHALSTLSLLRRQPSTGIEYIQTLDSYIQICSATTSLGMGIDIPDIEARDIPMSSDIKDLWQRIGRAMRKHRLLGRTVLFVPYWMFDRRGYGGPPAGEVESTDAPGQHVVRTKR